MVVNLMAVNTSASGSTQAQDSCRMLFLDSPANRSSPILLWDEDTPGASLNGHDPSELYIVQHKHWLRYRESMTSSRKVELVKQ